MIRRSLYPFTKAEILNIVTHAPEMIRYTKSNGVCADALMKELGMPRLPDGEHKDRTNLCISQSGPCIITNQETTERIRLYEAKRLPPTQENLNRVAAQKVIDIQNKARKQAAKDKKDANKERFQSLSAADQKAEKDEKKRLAAEKKYAIAEKARSDLENAQMILNA